MKKKVWQIASVTGTVALIAFIFAHSILPASESSEVSGGVFAAVKKLFEYFGAEFPLSHNAFRKLAHFLEYTALGAMLIVTTRTFTKNVIRELSKPLFLGLIIPIVDETIQLFSLGRSGELRDVWIDFSGVLAGTVFLLLILAIIENRKGRKTMIYEKLSGFSDEIDSSIALQFEVLNKLNIKYFEPRGIDGTNIAKISDKEVSVLKEKMGKYGIKASSIGSPVGKVYIEDDFGPQFEEFKRVVYIAKALDSKYIRMFSFYKKEGEWEEKRAEVFKRLKAMIDYARENSVVLLHENEKDIYGDTVERCVDLMENLACDSFKAVFDPANFVQCGEDTKLAYDKLNKYIEYMHIKDSRTDGKVVPAGHGEGNLKYILENLFKNGYNGFVSLEPHLGSFEGLADLELDDEMEKLPKGGEGTFTVAYNALCEILNEVL